jgi:hypothetical protein
MYKILYTFLLVFVAVQLAAQGTIVLQEDAGVRRLLDIRRSNNFKKDRTLRAWSVQIMISRDKYEVVQKTQEVRSIFRDDVNLKIDWSYEQPYYRINAGAFYTKMECASLLYRLMQRYPDAYIFKNDKVKPTDF